MKDIDKELSTILRKVVLFDEEDKLETELIENIKELFKESVPAETLVMPKTDRTKTIKHLYDSAGKEIITKFHSISDAELSLADTQWLIQNIDKAINSAKQAGQVEPEVKPACEIEGRIKEAEYWRDIIFSPEEQERKQTISLTDFILRIEELKASKSV